MLSLIVLSGLLSSFNLCNGYRILLVFPYPSRSHSILGEGYVNHLTKAGHDVTYITSYPMERPPVNLRQIDLSKNLELNDKFASELTLEKMIDNKIDLTIISAAVDFLYTITNNTISDQYVQEMMQDPKVDFDVVVVEWMYTEIYAGFSAVFDCPFIWSSSMEPHSMVLSLIDENVNTAYVPDHMSDTQPPLSFFERVKELFMLMAVKVFRSFLVGKETRIYKNGFELAVQKRGRNILPLQETKYNASMMLGNSHVSSGLAFHLPQSYKPIGGYHISDDVEPLPEHFKNLMDNATDGVVYFSLGSIVQSKTLPTVLKEELLKTLGELKQTVIWKFEEVILDVPSNVHIVQWAPQQSILAHPNCVLFITHGGLLSVTESLHYGVPVIGIPVFADQYINVKRVMSKGFGMEVKLNYDIPKNLKVALKEMLENFRYSEKVKELSIAYHDRPVRPGVELVHWVEHVVRTRGAPHLRSPGLMVPWYQKLYLDLILVLIMITLLVIKAFKYLISKLFAIKYDINKKDK